MVNIPTIQNGKMFQVKRELNNLYNNIISITLAKIN